ncbi:MAG TPA: phosphate ABC transporter substrate-binding protein [Bacteroidia bacterium]|nr:phosphate ABC transporter substrate-binding protein [Bacteroidia bacterium]
MALSGVQFTAAAQKVKGSDTVLPLSQKTAEVYMKMHPDATITVVGGGSGVGLAALIDGTTDIAMASRQMKMSEKMKLTEMKKPISEVIIAYDALSVVVNRQNKVSKLTRQQLEDIFTGKITNWKEVGGDDMAIVAYSRESSSGTFEFFKEHVMSKKNFAQGILNMPATGAIIQSVSQTKGAIGYVGLAYVDRSKVKDIAVSYDGVKYVEASIANAKNKTYPIVRPLYYYYAKADEQKVKPFVDFLLSSKGQAIVLQEGYIPLK